MTEKGDGALPKRAFVFADGKPYVPQARENFANESIVFLLRVRKNQDVINVMDDIWQATTDVRDYSMEYFRRGRHAKRETFVPVLAPRGCKDTDCCYSRRDAGSRTRG